jgi:hypothetical protein
MRRELLIWRKARICQSAILDVLRPNGMRPDQAEADRDLFR